MTSLQVALEHSVLPGGHGLYAGDHELVTGTAGYGDFINILNIYCNLVKHKDGGLKLEKRKEKVEESLSGQNYFRGELSEGTKVNICINNCTVGEAECIKLSYC